MPPAWALFPPREGSTAKGWVTVSELAVATYIGQVERDPDGILWAVLYFGDLVITRERVRSLRKGKRRVADLVLGASDTYTRETHRTSPTSLHRLVEVRAPVQRPRTRMPVTGPHPVAACSPAELRTAHSALAP